MPQRIFVTVNEEKDEFAIVVQGNNNLYIMQRVIRGSMKPLLTFSEV